MVPLVGCRLATVLAPLSPSLLHGDASAHRAATVSKRFSVFVFSRHDKKVVASKFVAIATVCFAGRCRPQHILVLSDGLQMPRIAAFRHSANVVKHKAFGYLATVVHVSKAMCFDLHSVY